MHADRMQLDKLVHEHCRLYEYNNFQPISVEAIAAFVSVRLYSRRFFPYYVFTAVAGLDENGDGVLYSYDPVGSYQRTEYGAEGSGRVLANSLLDNQAGLKGSHFERTDLSLGDALELLKTTFIALNERDIYTGDTAEVWILTADGVETREFELKKD